MDSIYKQMCETFPDYPCGKCKRNVDYSDCAIMKNCMAYRKFFKKFWQSVQINYQNVKCDDKKIQDEFIRLAEELEEKQ